MYARMFICLHVCTVYMHVYKYACIYIYICIHPHGAGNTLNVPNEAISSDWHRWTRVVGRYHSYILYEAVHAPAAFTSCP